MNLTLRERIATAINNHANNAAAADAAFAEAQKDLVLMYKVLDKTVTLLGTYPVKPGAKEIYDAADLMRKQYTPGK